MDVNAHGCAKMRTDHFYPENNNSVSLECQAWGDSVTFYGLPYEKAKALALLFADARTTVHFHGGATKPYLENVAAVDAMVAADQAEAIAMEEGTREELDAVEAAASPIETEF